MTTVAIIDDHNVVRAGLRFFLAGVKDIAIAAEGESAADAVRIAAKSPPDVLMLDLRMPGTDGLTALEMVRRKCPGQKILIVTTSDLEADICKAIEGGARGYALKDSSGDELINAIRAVADGRKYFPEFIKQRYVERDPKSVLSERELGILACQAKGLSTAAIMEKFGISESGVKFNFRKIFRKLGVASRSEAVATALARGLLRV